MSYPIVSPPVDEFKEKVPQLFQESIDRFTEFRGELSLYVKKEDIVKICETLRDHPELQFNYLADLTAVDHLREMQEVDPRFHVIYHLFSTVTKQRIRLKAPIFENHPVIDSVTSVWIAADWHERECYDMFGIHFEGHPDLRRILMPEDWEGYPLRKDYPVSDQEPYEYIKKQLADE